MLLELILSIILIGSLAAMVFMVVRKLPQLRTMPFEQGGPGFLDRAAKTVANNRLVKRFSMTKALEGVLKRTEKQSNLWLKKLKQRSASAVSYSDNYWQELKKSTHLAESIPIEDRTGQTQEPEEVKIEVHPVRGSRIKQRLQAEQTSNGVKKRRTRRKTTKPR